MPQTPLSERQAAILERIEANGFVTLDTLAETFGISMQTARRDVIALNAAGLVERFHGGAGLRPQPVPRRLDHAEKRLIAIEGKRRIAEAAARLVSPGDHLFLDVGTTAEAVATVLAAGPPVTVVTNNLHAAGLFDPAQHRVRVLPGWVVGPDGSIAGAETCAALDRLRLDIAFIGCSAVDPEGAAMDFDPDKIAVKRAAMAVSIRSVLIAGQEKFGRTAREVIAPVARFACLLTDGVEPE